MRMSLSVKKAVEGFAIGNLVDFPQDHFEKQFIDLMVHDKNHFIG
jgi:hypothetical protein